MPDNNQDRWHMKKEFNIAHILTTVTLFIVCMAYLNGMDKRIDANSQTIKFVQEQRGEAQKRVEKQLNRINEKLDRLLEK